MAIKEHLIEARNTVLKHVPSVGAPVYDRDGRRAASVVISKDGQERLVYRTNGRGVVDQTDQGLDNLGVKGGGNDYLNLAGKDLTKAAIC